MSQNREGRADERESENPKFFHKQPVKKVKFYRESIAAEESLAEMEDMKNYGIRGGGDIFDEISPDNLENI